MKEAAICNQGCSESRTLLKPGFERDQRLRECEMTFACLLMRDFKGSRKNDFSMNTIAIAFSDED
jgi:hypothetical protein